MTMTALLKRILSLTPLAQAARCLTILHHSNTPIERSSHIEENRLIASLQSNVETVNGLTIPLAALRD